MIPNVLSIAGSDPSGGAGVQGDLKTFAALGVNGMAAITAITVQGTRGVRRVSPLPAALVGEQVAAVLEDSEVAAIKIGMLARADIVEAVADALAGYAGPVVLDPVLVSSSGARLLAPDAEAALRERLLPRAAVVTPNLSEAAALTGAPVTCREEMRAAARALRFMGASAALVTGGHLEGPGSPDLLLTEGGPLWLSSTRVATENTHGTGCALSSAVAAWMARGFDVDGSCRRARAWIFAAIQAADQLSAGAGRGPVHHLHGLWP